MSEDQEALGLYVHIPFCELADVLDAGLLEVGEGRLRLTDRGLLLSNEVFRAFV